MNDRPAAHGSPFNEVTRAQDSTALSAATIGPYRLLQQVGEGGMGEVWLAEQTNPIRRQVALKLIKAGMDTAHVVARFEAERQALAMMDHPTIAKVFDAGATPQGRPYFVMEYVRGEPITIYCNRQRLSTRDRLDLFVQVCDGVQHAHQKGIIHRDLKPSNVLVTLLDEHAVPKIIDFGVAKAVAQPLTDRSLFTQLGALIGTPEYMSPEQAEMTPVDVDTRSDVYSLGVLLYELLVGTLPFDRETFRQAGLDDMRRTIREQSVPRPSTRLTQLGEQAGDIAQHRRTEAGALVKLLRGDLDWITLRALEKDRTRRYQTANALALDIQRHLNNEPVSAGPPSTLYRVGKFVRRHRVGVSIAASLIVMLVAFAVSTTVQAARIAREAERANRAEKAALEEAATSKSVLEFLQNDLLAQASAAAQAGPSTRPDPNLTVRTALDRAARSVPQKFAKQPIVEASIRQTIGTTYQDLGLYPEAQEQLERALELRRRALGDSDLDTLRTMTTLGDVYRVSGKFQQAEALLTPLLKIQRSRLGEEHPDTLASMGNLGLVYRYEGKLPQAEALYVKELDARRRLMGERHIDTLTVMNNLGLLYYMEGKDQQGEELLVKAKAASLEVLGAEHPVTNTINNSLALIYSGQKKYAEAEPLQRAVLEFALRVLGEKHPNTLTSMANLGSTYRVQRKFAEATPLLTRAVEIGREVQGAEHPNTLLSMQHLVELYVDEGNYVQASALVTEVLEGRRRVLGRDHAATQESMRSRADIAWRQRMLAESESLFLELLDSQRRTAGPTGTATLRTMTSVGHVRLEQRKYAQAEVILREASSAYEKVGTETWNRYRCESVLGAVLSAQKKHAEAETRLISGFEGLVRLRANIPAAERGLVANTAASLEELYRASGKPQEAAEWRAKAKSTD